MADLSFCGCIGVLFGCMLESHLGLLYNNGSVFYTPRCAAVVELVDTPDSKSCVLRDVPVQVRSAVPNRNYRCKIASVFYIVCTLYLLFGSDSVLTFLQTSRKLYLFCYYVNYMKAFTKDYYENTWNLAPSALLDEALSFVKSKSRTALDLGCGAGRDTKLLLQKGYDVIAIDNQAIVKPYIENLSQYGNVLFEQTTFEDFDYQYYSLINARYSLPFTSPESFSEIINKVISSLGIGGVFVGQLFGLNDEWNVYDSHMTFLNRTQIENEFKTLEIIKLGEKNEKGFLADGSSKHWHVYDIIAIRN